MPSQKTTRIVRASIALGHKILEASSGLFDGRKDIWVADPQDVREGGPLISVFLHRANFLNVSCGDLRTAPAVISAKLREAAAGRKIGARLRQKMLGAADRIERIGTEGIGRNRRRRAA